MKYSFIVFLVLCCAAALFSQSVHVHLYIGGAIDTSDAGVAGAIRVWETYLNSNPDSAYDNPNWLSAEKKRYPMFDFMNTAYFRPSLYSFLRDWKATVMSVSPIDGGFVVRTLFAKQTDSGYSRPYCITQIAAMREGGSYKLGNILPMSARSWLRETVGSIVFIFPPTHHFNRELAGRMNSFVDSLASMWGIKPFPVDFYLAQDMGDIMKMRGLDFYIGEGYNRGTGGVTDVANRVIYGAGQDEWYPHEFVHVYINPLFPNAHRYFLEGYAALLGGSKGHDLPWHMGRMQRYLNEHRDLDLNNVLAFHRFDYTTDPQYVFGGLLCHLALEKGGLPALKHLMSFGPEDRDFYIAVEKVLGVKQEDLNKFLRAELAAYVPK